MQLAHDGAPRADNAATHDGAVILARMVLSGEVLSVQALPATGMLPVLATQVASAAAALLQCACGAT